MSQLLSDFGATYEERIFQLERPDFAAKSMEG
jgi:hypothetical protein